MTNQTDYDDDHDNRSASLHRQKKKRSVVIGKSETVSFAGVTVRRLFYDWINA
jgi:hypothetical protein